MGKSSVVRRRRRKRDGEEEEEEEEKEEAATAPPTNNKLGDEGAGLGDERATREMMSGEPFAERYERVHSGGNRLLGKYEAMSVSLFPSNPSINEKHVRFTYLVF